MRPLLITAGNRSNPLREGCDWRATGAHFSANRGRYRRSRDRPIQLAGSPGSSFLRPLVDDPTNQTVGLGGVSRLLWHEPILCRRWRAVKVGYLDDHLVCRVYERLGFRIGLKDPLGRFGEVGLSALNSAYSFGYCTRHQGGSVTNVRHPSEEQLHSREVRDEVGTTAREINLQSANCGRIV